MPTLKQWEHWEAEVRADLMVFAQHSSGAHQQTISSLLDTWDMAKQGNWFPFPCHPVIFDQETRLRLFSAVLHDLCHTFIRHLTDRRAILSYILHDQRDNGLNQWPVIPLVYGPQRTPCIGFRNIRVSGGDGQDMEYYYFPGRFIAEYGREAALRESAVQI